MNSNDKDFDWYKSGVYVAHDPAGVPLLTTMNSSAHGCRASLTGRMQMPWNGQLSRMGYVIQEYVPAIPTLTEEVRISEQVATSTADRWRYPANLELAPPGVTVQLLTRGGVVVRGQWNDLGDYIAWAPMIKRDKEMEERLGL